LESGRKVIRLPLAKISSRGSAVISSVKWSVSMKGRNAGVKHGMPNLVG